MESRETVFTHEGCEYSIEIRPNKRSEERSVRCKAYVWIDDSILENFAARVEGIDTSPERTNYRRMLLVLGLAALGENLPNGVRHSRKAGCGCGCSPGYIFPSGVLERNTIYVGPKKVEQKTA